MKEYFIHAEEVCWILGVAMSTAYKIIRELNLELQQKGYKTVAGQVSRKYFNERTMVA